MAYAFVRNLKTNGGANIKDFAQIQSAERHAKREDLTSVARQRPGADHRKNFFWSKMGQGLEGGGADYTAAFRAHKDAHGVKTERKGAALALHLLVGVSPEWLAEGGDPHSLENPRIEELVNAAADWAETWMGADAIWAVRYDTDESGAGVVDILASPVREDRAGKAKTGKPAISVNKALKELQAATGEATSYAAMQTSWARYAQQNLDPALERGEPRSSAVHLSPEEFKAVVALRNEKAALEAEVADLKEQKAAEVRRLSEPEIGTIELELQERRDWLDRETARIQAGRPSFGERVALSEAHRKLEQAQQEVRVLQDANGTLERRQSRLEAILRRVLPQHLGPAPVLYRSFESDARHQGDRIWQGYTATSSSGMRFALRSPVA